MTKQNGEIVVNSKVFDIRNLISAVSNTPTKITPCAKSSLLRRGLKQRLRDYPGYEVGCFA